MPAPLLSSYPGDVAQRLADRAAAVNASLGPSYWRDLDEEAKFPWEALRALGEEGLLGTMVPRSRGGLEAGITGLSAAIESLSRSGAGLGSYLMLSNSIIAASLAEVGTQAQRDDVVPRLIDGSSVTCLGLAEASSGSDALSISTRAEASSGSFTIHGVKDYLNNSEKSLFMVIVARTTPAGGSASTRRSHGLTMFAVDPKAPGVSHRPHGKLGMRYFTTNYVVLDGVQVPREDVIGEVDRGWRYLVRMFNADRAATAAMLVGAGEFVLDMAVDYAKNRSVFGRPIGSNQAVQHRLAEAYARLAQARLLTYEASRLLDSGAEAIVEPAMAYSEAAEASWLTVDTAMQVISAPAYLRSVDLERHWRDVRLYRMAPLSRELSLSLIAEYGLGLPRSY